MFEMNHALVQDKLNGLQAEAENARRAREARADKPGGFDQLVRSMGQGLLRIGERAKLHGRPRHAI